MEKIELIIEEKDNEVRADKILASEIENLSRSFIQGLFEDGKVLVNGKTSKGKLKLKTGDKVEIEIPEPEELKVEPEDIDLDIIYEDKDVIVVNKEKGMVVHPAPGNYTGTLVNALLYHCKDLSGINGVIRPGIVHRIDKNTSGILVIAKNDFAHQELAEQFKEHSIKREYYAIVEGRMGKLEGTIDAPLGRHHRDRLKYAVVKDGKRAVTHYEVLEVYKGYSLVKCRLETGRTHQIRVHMAFIGHPLVGDEVYGLKKQKFVKDGQALHAKNLGFVHPTTKEYVEFSSKLPEYLKELIRKLGGEYED
ncbi:MAG: RluA family pseudouridine synthase [Sarcina sp.]